MQLTRLGHACIRLETPEGLRLVVDPGAFSDPDALSGADAVLVTHEHADHVQPAALQAALEEAPGLRVWTNASVAAQLGGRPGQVTVVGHGDAFSVGGLAVEVHGEWHAVIHPDLPRVANVGFLLGGTVLHPGDAFIVPGRPVETLMLPLHAPWSKLGEVIDYVREVLPDQAIPIHDGMLTETGRGFAGTLLQAVGAPYQAVAPDGIVSVG